MSTLVPERQLLTVRETAERLAISEKSVRRRVRAGVIPALRLGHKGSAIRIPADELAGWIDERRTVGTLSPPSPAENPAASARVPEVLGPGASRGGRAMSSSKAEREPQKLPVEQLPSESGPKPVSTWRFPKK
jgi:excisionase family DNA binding protein